MKSNVNRPSFDTEAAVLTYQNTIVAGQFVTVMSGVYRSAFETEADRFLPVVRRVHLGPTRTATLRATTESPYATAVVEAIIDGIPVAVSGNAPSETLVSFARTLRPIGPTRLGQMQPAKPQTFVSTDSPSVGPIAHGVFADGITWRVFLSDAGPGTPLRLALITVPNRPDDADEADIGFPSPGSIQSLATVHGTIVIATRQASEQTATLHVATGNEQVDTTINRPTPGGTTVVGIVATQAFGIPHAHATAPDGQIIIATS